MKILKTESELRNTRHADGIGFLCGCCKKTFPVQTDGAAGYAYFSEYGDKPICYVCANKIEVEHLKDRSKPYVGYLGDGVVTTWTGGELMKITMIRGCTLTRRSHWHSRDSFCSVHAVDPHGGHWAGRGSEGIAIRMRPVKGGK